MNDTEAFGDDLDLLAAYLTRLENRISGPASAGGSGTVRIDPEDIAALGRQIGSLIRSELEAGRNSGPNDSVGDEPGRPDPSKHPSIIASSWRRSQNPSAEDGLGPDTDPRSDELGLCREALERLRKHEEETARQIASLSRQVERATGRRQAAAADCENVPAESQNKHGETQRSAALESARARAYALHAAGKYDEASAAYQDYFDLLGSAFDDVSTLQVSRECALQARRIRRRTGRRWTVTVLAVAALGIGVGCALYVAERTAERARWTLEHAGPEGLDVYCERLESVWFSIGTFGLAGYLYGPEISTWRSLVDEAEEIRSDPAPVTVNSNDTAAVTACTASDDAEETAEAVPVVSNQTVLAGSPAAATVVTNYLVPPVLSLGLAPRGAEAAVYNSRFEKTAMEHSVSLLEPGERYLISAGKGGYEPYMEPIDADWQGVKRIEVSLSRARGKGAAGSSGAETGPGQ
jgi:hypothetical protein